MALNTTKEEAIKLALNSAKRLMNKFPNSSLEDCLNYFKPAFKNYFNENNKNYRELYQLALDAFKEEWRDLKSEKKVFN